MIKLFRNTRRKLLSENKFSKYLAYAIGEIFLVVVGILIALWINTKNQERINEQKAEVILKEIQRDLKKDIESSKWVVNKFITYDSIARLLLWDKLTPDEMFVDENVSYGIVYSMVTFETSDNGYVNFKRSLDNIPSKYDAITNELKDLYDITGGAVEVSNDRMVSTVHKNLDKINTFDWHVETMKMGMFSEEGKHYYMKDLEFKKVLLKYMNDIKNVFLKTEQYRLKAVQLHNKISEILNNDAMLPFPSPLNSTQNALALKRILGTYKLKETMSDKFPPIIEFRIVDNKLHLLAEGYPPGQYYFYNESTCFGASQLYDSYLNNINFNKSNPKTLYWSVAKSAYAYYTKIKD